MKQQQKMAADEPGRIVKGCTAVGAAIGGTIGCFIPGAGTAAAAGIGAGAGAIVGCGLVIYKYFKWNTNEECSKLEVNINVTSIAIIILNASVTSQLKGEVQTT